MIFWIPAFAGMTTFMLIPAIAIQSLCANDSLRCSYRLNFAPTRRFRLMPDSDDSMARFR